MRHREGTERPSAFRLGDPQRCGVPHPGASVPALPRRVGARGVPSRGSGPPTSAVLSASSPLGVCCQRSPTRTRRPRPRTLGAVPRLSPCSLKPRVTHVASEVRGCGPDPPGAAGSAARRGSGMRAAPSGLSSICRTRWGTASAFPAAPLLRARCVGRAAPSDLRNAFRAIKGSRVPSEVPLPQKHPEDEGAASRAAK